MDLQKTFKKIIESIPNEWLELTTHRLDIYDEKNAKTDFIQALNRLIESGQFTSDELEKLPTAYDYIRLGHPLSCLLEFYLAKRFNYGYSAVIAFSSKTAPIIAVLRKNKLLNKRTRIIHNGDLPISFERGLIKKVYGFDFSDYNLSIASDLDGEFEGSTIFYSETGANFNLSNFDQIDFQIFSINEKGSLVFVSENNQEYIREIQHVRRRETIAMTPIDCYNLLDEFIGKKPLKLNNQNTGLNKSEVQSIIKNITQTTSLPIVGSSGLSIQYAIVMGIVEHCIDSNPDKKISLIVPTNCYGGTNDQARRVAQCSASLSVIDLFVDGKNDMLASLDSALEQAAKEDSVPIIIAEIPTNPRVEVPDLNKLKKVLIKKRYFKPNQEAIQPIFILDQTFCPNVPFLSNNQFLNDIRAISYVSGSKFPSGGKVTAGYCTFNKLASSLHSYIEKHLLIADNEATDFQYYQLAKQMPSMLNRIDQAYLNTQKFVDFIQKRIPLAKINFVTLQLVEEGFKPSVFSLDLPTKGSNSKEKELFKRALNEKLINYVIKNIPSSKYCVSYGQLKGSYWTIPATSTQGTTQEVDKDYIARVSVAPSFDLDLHQKVVDSFCKLYLD